MFKVITEKSVTVCISETILSKQFETFYCKSNHLSSFGYYLAADKDVLCNSQLFGLVYKS